MVNPVRRMAENLGYNFRDELSALQSPLEIRNTRTAAKLWIGGFALASAAGVVVTWGSGIDANIEQDTPVAEAVELAIELAWKLPAIVPTGLSILGMVEGVCMNRAVNERLGEIQPRETGFDEDYGDQAAG